MECALRDSSSEERMCNGLKRAVQAQHASLQPLSAALPPCKAEGCVTQECSWYAAVPAWLAG